MSPDDFAKATEKSSAEQLATFEEIKKQQNQQTSEQLAVDFYDKEKTTGINVVLGAKVGSQAAAVKGSQDALLGADRKGGDGTFVGATAKVAKIGYNKAVVNNLGLIGAAGGGLEAITQGIESFAKLIPGVGTIIIKANEELKKLIPGAPEPADASTSKKDMKDGIIKFHPADKFAAVPDGATILASTGTGQLASAVDTLTGGGKTAVVDPGPIAAAVASAIQSAMSGMKIEMDGYNLAKAMEFSNRTLNG
jgi:hypothetical protein